MKLNVELVANITEESSYIINDHHLGITVTEDEDIKQICQYEKIEQQIRAFFRDRGYFYDGNDLAKYEYSNYDSLQLECYDRNVNISSIVNFLKQNDLKQFHTITIVLDDDKYGRIDQFLNQDLPTHIVFKRHDSVDEIPYNDLIKIGNIVNNISEIIKDLSPLEQVMYLYDEIRNKIYFDHMNKTSYLDYVNLFHLALKKLNINAKREVIKEKNSSKTHARNIIYIDDSKYNIKSISLFDLIFDSETDEQDDSYLQSYKYFARTLSKFKNKEFEQYDSEIIPFFDLEHPKRVEVISSMNQLDDIKSHDFIFSMQKLGKLCNKNIDVSKFVDAITGKVDSKMFLKAYSELQELLETEITPEVFTNCLIAVRQKQIKQNKEKYHLDADEISTIVHNRYRPESTETELLLSLLNKKYFTKEDAEEIVKNSLGKNNQSSPQKKKI